MNDRGRDRLYDVICEVQDSGLSIRDFLVECEDAWQERHRFIAEADKQKWKELLKRRET